MKRLAWSLTMILGGGAAWAADKPKDAPPAAAPATATAEIKTADGKKIGDVTLEETAHGVLVHGKLTGAPAGDHAFHIHETGKCEAPFKTAGGHWNPGKKHHGAKNKEGMHAGDLPNLHIPADGNLEFDALVPGATLTQGKEAILDADGAALVLHATGDDYASDPAGNAGDRIACGVIAKAPK
jgi:superoxide dismutase, Cu-Zn family